MILIEPESEYAYTYFSTQKSKYAHNKKPPLWPIKNRQPLYDEWAACITNPRRPLDTLYQILLPNLLVWEHQFLNRYEDKQLEFFCLIACLPYENNPQVLYEWASEHFTELRTYVFLCYLKVLRHPQVQAIPYTASHWIFMVATYMRYFLRQEIELWYYKKNKHTRRFISVPNLGELITNRPCVEDELASSLLDLRIQVSQLPYYEQYLINLYLADYEKQDIISFTNTTSSYANFWSTLHDYFETTGYGIRQRLGPGSFGKASHSFGT